MNYRAEIAAEAERLAELVRANAYIRQKGELYVDAVELYRQATEMVGAGARHEHMAAMKKQLEHAAVMLAGALQDAKDTLARAQMMSPGQHHNHAAESGRSLSQ